MGAVAPLAGVLGGAGGLGGLGTILSIGSTLLGGLASKPDTPPPPPPAPIPEPDPVPEEPVRQPEQAIDLDAARNRALRRKSLSRQRSNLLSAQEEKFLLGE